MFAPYYKEATILTSLKLDGEDIVLDVPVTPYLGIVYCNGIIYDLGAIRNADLVGSDCIAHIVYPANQDVIVTSFPGYQGRGYEATLTQGYQLIVGSSEPFCVFLQQDYVDG